MSDLISRSALLQSLRDKGWLKGDMSDSAEMIAGQSIIDDAHTIDPESLRPKGRWILTNEDYEYLTCSVCGGAYYTGAETFARAQDHLTFAGGYNYCPNCGADMRGEGDE